MTGSGRRSTSELEEQMLVELGGADTEAYGAVALTGKEIDTSEDEDAFDVSLDLNRIAREWGSG